MCKAKSLLAVVVAIGVFVPAASASAYSIGLLRPWGNAAYNQAGSMITVTYSISAGRGVPTSAFDAVKAGFDHWNSCLSGSNAFSETLDSNTFSTTDSGCPTLSFKGDWRFLSTTTAPLVKVSIKKGGGNIAGQTRLSYSRSGFIKAATVQISASSFGRPNTSQLVWEIATHELGHVVGLGHSNDPNDLMYPTLNNQVSIGSCEINGAEALYGSWLPDGSAPALPSSGSVTC